MGIVVRVLKLLNGAGQVVLRSSENAKDMDGSRCGHTRSAKF